MNRIEKLMPNIDWQDSERVNVLYAPFRARNLNPESYEAKMSFWTEAIEKWLEEEKKLKFTLNELTKVFENQVRRPKCLEEVVLDLKTNKKIVESKEFTASFQETWSDLPWKMLKSTSSFVLSSLSPKSKEQQKVEFAKTQFIHLEMVEKRCNSLVDRIKDVGNVYCKKSDIFDSDEEVDFLLDYLKFKGIVDFQPIDDDIYIKVSSKITENDVAVINLELCIVKLETNTEDLDHRIREKKMELKNCIAKGDSRSKAKSILKQVKHLESELLRKTNSLDNLRQVFEKLQEAKENKKIIQALSLARKALKSEMEEMPETESVQDLIDDLKDLVEKNDEVSEMVSAGHDQDLSDQDLENELRELLEKENEQELQAAIANLKVNDAPINDSAVKTEKKCDKLTA